MAGKDHRLELIVNQLSRRIVVTVDFISDDVDLAIYLALRVNTMEYNIGQEVDRAGKVVTQDSGIVDSLLLRSIGVQVAADPLEAIGDVAGPPTACALEGQVLAKMSHTAVRRVFVTRAGHHDVAAINHVGRRGFMYDTEPVGQGVFVERSHTWHKSRKNKRRPYQKKFLILPCNFL